MYGISYHVSAPIEAYDVLHKVLVEVTDESGEGLLVHVARPTADGFEIIEVWESEEHFGTFMRQTLPKAVARLPSLADAPPPAMEEFELRGFLVYATGKIMM